MPPKSRGKPAPPGLLSRSTPNLPTLQQLEAANQLGSSGDSTRIADTRPIANALDNSPTGGAIIENGQDEDAEPLDLEESGGSDTEDEEVGEDEEEEQPPARRPLYTSRSHSQLPRQTASTLFPPFYNRPPTPLPPSPSLTSLLRPSFPSRRTTPDSSDIDLPTGRLAPPNANSGTSTRASSTSHLATSARHAPRIPRASPKIPTYEYYGFALYLGSSAAFLMYILWAYVPAPMLHQMGIYYYPNRWWALAVPCWLIALIIYIYVALASWNTGHLTLKMGRVECLVDECAQVAVVDRRTGQIVRDTVLVTDKLHERDKEKGTRARSGIDDFDAYRFKVGEEVNWKDFWSTGTDAVMDVPIGGVCEILYGN